MTLIKPLNDKVILVECNDEKEESGIILPDKKENEKIFTVVSFHGIQTEIKDGDKVIIDDYAGKERIINGEKLYFVDFSDIIAVIK